MKTRRQGCKKPSRSTNRSRWPNLKEEVRTLWECRSARAAAAHLQNGILKAMASGVSALRSLGPSLLKHAKHILSYFQVPITSAMMEGINKISRLQRTAYG